MEGKCRGVAKYCLLLELLDMLWWILYEEDFWYFIINQVFMSHFKTLNIWITFFIYTWWAILCWMKHKNRDLDETNINLKNENNMKFCENGQDHFHIFIL